MDSQSGCLNISPGVGWVWNYCCRMLVMCLYRQSHICVCRNPLKICQRKNTATTWRLWLWSDWTGPRNCPWSVASTGARSCHGSTTSTGVRVFNASKPKPVFICALNQTFVVPCFIIFLSSLNIYIYIFFFWAHGLTALWIVVVVVYFFSDNIEVALLRTLTKEDLLTFYKVYICTQTYNCLLKRMLPDETLMWSVSNTSITWKHETKKPVDSPTLVSTFSQCELLSHERRLQLYKGRFTRCNLLYNTLTTRKKVVGFENMF